MGQAAITGKAEQPPTQGELLSRFARLMRDRYNARIYLFGSRARGTAHEYSDYDLVAVSSAFEGQSRFCRCLDRGEMWLAAGGWRKALDLHCYTPREFLAEVHGLGYLGQARAKGELLPIKPAPRMACARAR